MAKTKLVITMAPTVQVEENDLIVPIVMGCIENAPRMTKFKVTIDKIADGKIKFTEPHNRAMIQIDELKKFDVVLDSDDPKMWTIFRDMTRFVCKVTATEHPTPIPIKCYMGEIIERRHNQIETPPYVYTAEQYFIEPMMPNDDDSDDDSDGDGDPDWDGDSDSDDDPDQEERERQELDESRRERRRDIRAYYYDRI